MARAIVILLLLTIVFLCAFFLRVLPPLLFCSSPPEHLGSRSARAPRSGEILPTLQNGLRQCVATNGLGLQAEVKDHCHLLLKYSKGTNSTWFNRQFKVFEPLDYLFNVCDTLLLWEQVGLDLQNANIIYTQISII